MNIRDLKYLLALIDHKHFGKAAEACFVSQPALSMQIKKLEETLGVKLLERSNKQVLITDIGRRIAEYARHIVNQVDELFEMARAESDPFSGQIKLGIIPTLAPYLLPHIMPVLSKKFPRLSVYLLEEQTSVLLERLDLGLLDLAILALPVSGKQLVCTPLFEETFFLAVANNHLLANKKSVSQQDLKNKDILLLEEGHCLRDQALDICYKMKVNELVNFRATSLETLRYMVAAGAGMTLIPELAKRKNDGITYLPFANAKPVRQIGACWRRSTVKAELFDEIIKFLKVKI